MIDISFSVDSFFVIEYFFYEKPQHLLSSDWNLETQQKENVLPFILFSIFIVERHKCSFFMIVYILEITELLWKKNILVVASVQLMIIFINQTQKCTTKHNMLNITVKND